MRIGVYHTPFSLCEMILFRIYGNLSVRNGNLSSKVLLETSIQTSNVSLMSLCVCVIYDPHYRSMWTIWRQSSSQARTVLGN